MSRWSHLLFALIICVAALGCSSAAGQGGGDNPTQQSKQAIGAPVKIPAFQEHGQDMYTPPSPDTGEEPAGAKLDFEKSVRDACKDGTLCLNVQVLPSGANLETCTYDHLEYPKGTKLGDPQNDYNYDGSKVAHAHDTVYMVCNPRPPTDSSESSQDTTASPESSQPQSSDTTRPADSGQSPPSSS